LLYWWRAKCVAKLCFATFISSVSDKRKRNLLYVERLGELNLVLSLACSLSFMLVVARKGLRLYVT
jgi:hypothetical protein